MENLLKQKMIEKNNFQSTINEIRIIIDIPEQELIEKIKNMGIASCLSSQEIADHFLNILRITSHEPLRLKNVIGVLNETTK